MLKQLNEKSILKYALLVLLANALSVLTFVFGALPMKVIRRVYGRVIYWLGFSIAVSVLGFSGNISSAVIVGSLAIMVGLYSEIEDHGGEVFTAGFVGLLATVGAIVTGYGAWFYLGKGHLTNAISEQVSQIVTRMNEMNPNLTVNSDAILQQLPSIAIIGFLLAMAIALIGETKLLMWLGARGPYLHEVHADLRKRLSAFRVPDALVWVAIAGIFGAFYRHGNALAETVSINALNVLAVLYFFQGMAVIAYAFKVFRVSSFWRSLWYLILVLQLFLVVSLIGFVDFWVEFRERLSPRKPAATNKGF